MCSFEKCEVRESPAAMENVVAGAFSLRKMGCITQVSPPHTSVPRTFCIETLKFVHFQWASGCGGGEIVV